MQDQHDRQSAVGQASAQGHDVRLVGRIQARRRLIEQQHLRRTVVAVGSPKLA
jgi:hypothetical protein